MANWRNRRLTAGDEALVAEVEKQLTAPTDTSSQPAGTEAERFGLGRPLFTTRQAMLKMLRGMGEDIDEAGLITRINDGLRLWDVTDALLAALSEAQRERERLVGVANRLTRERNEARDEAERFHRESRDSAALHGRAVRERDELAALLDVTAASRDQYHERFKVEAAAARLMRPVVEAAREQARVMRLVVEVQDGGLSRPGRALLAAVDTYETQTGGTDG